MKQTFLDIISRYSDYVPFVAMVNVQRTSSDGDVCGPRLLFNWSRIIELLFIVFSVYLSIQMSVTKLETKVQDLSCRLEKLEQQILYRPLGDRLKQKYLGVKPVEPNP